MTKSQQIEVDDFALLRASVIEDTDDLVSIEDEWWALYMRCYRPNPCATPTWVLTWWDTFGGQAKGAGDRTKPFFVLIRNAEGTLVGVFPMYEDRPRRGSMLIRRLRDIGFLGREGGYDMTEDSTALVAPSQEGAVLQALAGVLRAGLSENRWDLLMLRRSTDETPTREPFVELGRTAWCRASQREGSYFAHLPDTWTEYRKQLTKSMRDNLGYYPRLLNREGRDWQLRTWEEPSDVLAASNVLANLHQVRAKQQRGQEHHDHIHDEIQRAFFTTLLSRLAEDGRATITELLIDNKVVASQAFVEDRDQLLVYYSGFSEEWYRYSPIFIIDSHVFRGALERGVRHVNFLRTRALWKTRWGANQCRTLDRLYAVRKRPIPLLRVLWYVLAVMFKMDVVGRLS
jgi:CelD/BcsL family acetyltransferase involved in cellulose biosynthesis